jgi:hypothetical protein
MKFRFEFEILPGWWVVERRNEAESWTGPIHDL